MTVLSNARWPEVAAGPRRLLVVPLGSVEQHGPHLPMYTDTRIAVAVASRACAGRPGVGLAPAVTIGASGEHAGFPGTLSIGTQALALLLVELGRHASLHWPAMLLVNGHGGNIPAITSAIATLREEGRACHVWHGGLSPAQLAEAGIPAGVADAHAGRFETSIMLALAPELVRMDEAKPGETRPVADLMPALREHGVRAVSPNGVLGDPAGASAAEGRALLGVLVASLARMLDELLAENEQAGRQVLPDRPTSHEADRAGRVNTPTVGFPSTSGIPVVVIVPFQELSDRGDQAISTVMLPAPRTGPALMCPWAQWRMLRRVRLA